MYTGIYKAALKCDRRYSCYIYIYEELETMRIVSHDHIAQLPETIEGPLAVGFIILYC